LINRSSSSEINGEEEEDEETKDGKKIDIELLPKQSNLKTSEKLAIIKLAKLTKNNSSEHLKELVANENLKKSQLKQQAKVQETSPQTPTTPTPPKPTDTDNFNDKQNNNNNNNNNTTTNSNKNISTTNETRTARTNNEELSDNKNDEDDEDEKTLDPEDLLEEGDMIIDFELDYSNRCEFDDIIFSSDVATPALEEPEVFDISGSSASLLTPTTFNRSLSEPPSTTAKAKANNNNGSGSESGTPSGVKGGDTPSATSNSKAREYKLIHSMFANKSRLESKKS
jgi:hypothetical protein